MLLQKRQNSAARALMRESSKLWSPMSGQNLDARSSSPKSHDDILGSVLLDETNAEIGDLVSLDSKQNKTPGGSHDDD